MLLNALARYSIPKELTRPNAKQEEDEELDDFVGLALRKLLAGNVVVGVQLLPAAEALVIAARNIRRCDDFGDATGANGRVY